jgi:hypothetical protein
VFCTNDSAEPLSLLRFWQVRALCIIIMFLIKWCRSFTFLNLQIISCSTVHLIVQTCKKPFSMISETSQPRHHECIWLRICG